MVEVLLSVAILSIGAVLVMQALARGAYAISTAGIRNHVYEFAAAKLADVEVGSARGVIPQSSGGFTADGTPIQWQLDSADMPEEPGLEQRTLTVRWGHGDHRYAEQFTTVYRIPLEAVP